jgi:hypothetical protein
MCQVLRRTWWPLIKLVTVLYLYVIPDTLLKVSLNANKTGHHVIRYTWYIVKVSLKTNKTGHHDNMVTSFIGV